MKEPIWPSERIVYVVHEQHLRIHGGMSGVRDNNLLLSALAYPQNLFAYQPESTMPQLGAAYAARLAKDHAFVDGNKRTAWLLCFLFLRLNDYRVTVPEAEVVIMTNGIAEGSIAEHAFAQWLSGHCAKEEAG